ncbi:MAG: DNA polymerase III subunit delta [Clostridia bacterium]|nr:DNA polymerase III subunit delta [Clostridia bacterium]
MEKMTVELLEKELNSDKELRTLYLLYGEEQFLLDSCLKKIKKRFGDLLQGINYVIIDETSIDDLIYNIESPAFGYDQKLIIVKNSGLFKKDGRKKQGSPVQEKIAEYLMSTELDHDVVIVFIEETVDKNNVFEALSQNGVIVEFKELDELSLVKRLKQIAAMYKVTISDQNVKYLIEVSGTNMQYLINEIRKLIEFAGPNGTIDKDAIDKLAIKQIDSVIFDLTDNLGNKKTQKALEVLNGLIYNKEPLQKILVTLYNHFKKLYLCSIAVKNNRDIASSIGLKPNQTFLVNKYKRQLNFFQESSLRKILEEFVNLDYNSKNGKIDLEIGLKSILCNYC